MPACVCVWVYVYVYVTACNQAFSVEESKVNLLLCMKVGHSVMMNPLYFLIGQRSPEVTRGEIWKTL